MLFVAVTVVATQLVDWLSPNWVVKVVATVVAIVLLIRAWLMRRRPALILNRDGIWTWDRRLLAKWSELALIWIGEARLPSRTGRGKSTLFAWTAVSVGYAKHAGLMPEPKLVVKLETTMPLAEIPVLIRRFTDCAVHTGGAKAF